MKILFWILGIFIFLIIVIILESIRELKTVKTVKYNIESPKLPKAFDGKRAVFFSDFHNALNGKNNALIEEKIDTINPEFILIGGDMITGKKGTETEAATKLLNKLAKKYTIYYGKGNHEKRVAEKPQEFGDMWEKYYSSIDKSIKYLEDEKAVHEIDGEKINIYGLDLGNWFYKRFFVKVMDVSYLDSKLGKSEKGCFNILLAHNPDYFPVYSDWGADLSLAGHFHGGIIRLPFLGGVISPRLTPFPHFDRGLYTDNGNKMILSSGLGQHSINIRFNNIPEIIEITFTSK